MKHLAQGRARCTTIVTSKQALGCINRTFSSRDHNSVYVLEVNRHLGVQLAQYVITVYAISIKKPIGRRLYSCFNLCINGILSDSTHIRSIISISLIL